MPRICPHCKIAIPTNRDFSFDEKLNLICGNCDKIAFSTNKESQFYDLKIEKPLESE